MYVDGLRWVNKLRRRQRREVGCECESLFGFGFSFYWSSFRGRDKNRVSISNRATTTGRAYSLRQEAEVAQCVFDCFFVFFCFGPLNWNGVLSADNCTMTIVFIRFLVTAQVVWRSDCITNGMTIPRVKHNDVKHRATLSTQPGCRLVFRIVGGNVVCASVCVCYHKTYRDRMRA